MTVLSKETLPQLPQPPLSWTPFYTLDVTMGSLSVRHRFPQKHLHVRDRGFDILKLLGLVLWSKVGQKQSNLTSCDTCLIIFLQPDQGFSEGGPHPSVAGHHQLFQQQCQNLKQQCILRGEAECCRVKALFQIDRYLGWVPMCTVGSDGNVFLTRKQPEDRVHGWSRHHAAGT